MEKTQVEKSLMWVHNMDVVKSVYIHIPFCEEICSYCDFCKMYYNKEFVTKYLSALKKEIVCNYKGDVVDNLYIGGGTPSCLDIDDLKELFSIIKLFNLSDSCEFTVECNFENTSYEKLKLFYNNGVNRLSFGLETTDRKLLSLLERKFDKNKVLSTITDAKNIGISNINVDLMYALVGQNIDMLKEDLSFILGLNVTHVSLYSLILEEHTKLFLKGVHNVSEEIDYKMYSLIHEVLSKNNYIHYEVSNYCLDGYQSLHNTNYWKNGTYYGFGLGSGGYVNNIRYQNTRSLFKYLEGDYLYNKEVIDNNIKMSYEMILGLRIKDGVSKDSFYCKYGCYPCDVFSYDDLIDNGFLIEDDKFLYIPYDKWYVMDNILLRFLEVNDGKE